MVIEIDKVLESIWSWKVQAGQGAHYESDLEHPVAKAVVILLGIAVVLVESNNSCVFLNIYFPSGYPAVAYRIVR